MKILFTGGGTGGHFYPIIAVAQEIKKIAEEQKLVEPKMFFMSDTPYNKRALFENDIQFIPTKAGKLRRYFSIRNFLDIFKTAFGLVQALWKIYGIYPDVIFSKGGYASFPTLFAGRILNIPIIIHESDSHPGKVSLWSSKFAERIALSYPEAGKYFPKAGDKLAVVGNPLRKEIINAVSTGAYEFLNLNKDIPVIFVVGGSQGSIKINETILDILPQLLEKYQIIHQVGANNYNDIQKRIAYLLSESKHKERYHSFDYLNSVAMRMTAGIASLVVSRAGSAIFEFANWGIPSIIIPIPEEISHDQRTNAFTYARSGGAIVIEEKNLTPSILLSEIDRLMSNPELQAEMKKGAKSFARPDAGKIIAEEILKIALKHENA